MPGEQRKGKRDDTHMSLCYMPQAENITAEFIAGANGVGPHSINVSWEYAAKPRGVQYCDFSRQWQIRSFNSTNSDQLEDGKEPSVFRDFEFLNMIAIRDTFFECLHACSNDYA